MLYKKIHPIESLKPLIRYYIYIEFKNEGQNFWIPADLRNQFFILHKGKALVTQQDNSYYHDEYAVKGCFSKPSNVSFSGTTISALVTEFTEIGIKCLFKTDIASLVNNFIPGKNAIQQTTLSAFKDIKGIGTIEGKIDRINSIFNSLSEDIILNNPFRKSIKIAKEHEGNIKVIKLAEDSSLHPKTLQRYFQQYTGLTTKQYLGQLKFQYACKEILCNTDKQQQLEALRGFYDQSHMINNFVKYGGTSPGKIEILDTSWVDFLIESDLY